MTFKFKVGVSCIAVLLILFTKVASAASVYQATFSNGLASGGVAYLVMEADTATGMYFDYDYDGSIDPTDLLHASPEAVGLASGWDVASLSIDPAHTLVQEVPPPGTVVILGLMGRAIQQAHPNGDDLALSCVLVTCDIVNHFAPMHFAPAGVLTLNDGNAEWTLRATSVIPVPTAAWLFGSGLIGLIGVARRKVRV